MLQTQYSKDKFIRFPSMDHFSDCFGTPRESWKHTDTSFWVSEKLDGANLGLYIPASGSCSCFSRSGENACGGLFKFIADKDVLEPMVITVQNQLRSTGILAMYLWGEYYGQNVCRRIGYKGPLGQFKFFDGFTEHEGDDGVYHRRLTPPRIKYLAEEYLSDFKDFFVEYTSYLNSSYLDLKDALPLPCVSAYSKDPMEGYVITEVNQDAEFVGRWKYKDPAFKDHAAKKKIEVTKNPQITALNEEYLTYFNENRVLDTLSKTTERNKLDMLCKMLINDAREDFLKSHEKELISLSDKEKKFVLYSGSLPFLLLKDALKKEKERDDN